jgi:hypothetical protein
VGSGEVVVLRRHPLDDDGRQDVTEQGEIEMGAKFAPAERARSLLTKRHRDIELDRARRC